MSLEASLETLVKDLRERAANTRRHAVDPNVPKTQNPLFMPQIEGRIYTAEELVAMAEQAERDADQIAALLTVG